jgi:isopentenyl-diphosphate delta-isomerase
MYNPTTQNLSIEVDKDDNIIGLMPTKDFFRSNHIHRSAHLLLFNSKGELLLQKRTETKKAYPNVWDNSVAGFVDEGESYYDCVLRETREEIGVAVKPRPLFHYIFFDNIYKAHKEVYSARYDGPFDMSKREISELKWISLAELKKKIAERPTDFCPPFVECMRIYFQKFGIKPV